MDRSMKKKFFSVAIPTWDIKGKGADYLEYSFNILAHQTFKDFEIVVSDHSLDDNIENLCRRWRQVIDIKYYHNNVGRGKIAPNMNNAIKKSTGRFIKMLFQDDFLYDADSLEIIYNSIQKNQDKSWFITGCVHTDDCITMYDRMIPYYHDKIHEGINTISCPTVLTVRNDHPLFFDESLNWLVDVEYYKRLYDRYGLPVVIDEICAVNRNAEVRTTNMTTDLQKAEEINRVISMYETAQ